MNTMTFSVWTGTRQISAAPNSRRYQILLVPFWKMMSFETKWIAFFFQIYAAFYLVHVLLQKQCCMLMRHYHFKAARYVLCND